MLGLYLGAFAFGGILIGVSILLGDSEHDFDKDFDVDHDVDLDADADLDADLDADAALDLDAHGGADVDKDLHLDGEAAAGALWLPFLSMRFWTFGAAAFGFVGAILHFLVPMAIALAFAVLAGLSIGTGAAWFFRQLKRHTITGSVGLSRWVGQEARVVLPVRPGGVGKIAIDAPDGRIELVARTRDERPIDVGRVVLIASIEDGTADVTAMPELPDARQQHRRTTRTTR